MKYFCATPLLPLRLAKAMPLVLFHGMPPVFSIVTDTLYDWPALMPAGIVSETYVAFVGGSGEGDGDGEGVGVTDGVDPTATVLVRMSSK